MGVTLPAAISCPAMANVDLAADNNFETRESPLPSLCPGRTTQIDGDDHLDHLRLPPDVQ